MMNADSQFGTLRYPLVMYTSSLFMSLITKTTNRTGLNPISAGLFWLV